MKEIDCIALKSTEEFNFLRKLLIFLCVMGRGDFIRIKKFSISIVREN